MFFPLLLAAAYFSSISCQEKKEERENPEKEHIEKKEKKKKKIKLDNPLSSALAGTLFLGGMGLITSPFLLSNQLNEKELLLGDQELKKSYSATMEQKETSSLSQALEKIKDSDLRKKYKELFYRIELAKKIKKDNFISLYEKERLFLDKITNFTKLQEPETLQDLQKFLNEELINVVKRELEVMEENKLSDKLLFIKKKQINNWKKVQTLLDEILKTERAR